MPSNNFLPFTPTDTGTNLLNQSDYAAATDRTIGNQPGVASSKLNNKAIRQATYVVSQLAQYMVNQLGEDVLDDATPAKLLAQFMATMKPYAPNITRMTSGTGTFNLTYIFQMASGNASAGATYTNNAVTFTVVSTVSAQIEVKMTGNGDPSLGGTLTKTGGSGDATLTFYAFRKAVSLQVIAVAGGGGGGGSGTANGTAGTAGGNTTFGTSLHTAVGGAAGSRGGSQVIGGTVTVGAGATNLVSAAGGYSGSGSAASASSTVPGGIGGASPLGGAGGPGSGASTTGGTGSTAIANTGSGGGGAGSGSVSLVSGAGGGCGGYLNILIPSPASSYAWGVGAAGTHEAAGTSGAQGGDGAAGLLVVIENYQ